MGRGGRGCQDISALYSGGLDDGAQGGEALCAAARADRGVMVDDAVRGGGLLEGRAFVARLAVTRSARPGPLAFGALALLASLLPGAVARRRLAAVGAVERQTPLELGDARAQPRIVRLRGGLLRSAQTTLPRDRGRGHQARLRRGMGRHGCPYQLR